MLPNNNDKKRKASSPSTKPYDKFQAMTNEEHARRKREGTEAQNKIKKELRARMNDDSRIAWMADMQQAMKESKEADETIAACQAAMGVFMNEEEEPRIVVTHSQREMTAEMIEQAKVIKEEETAKISKNITKLQDPLMIAKAREYIETQSLESVYTALAPSKHRGLSPDLFHHIQCTEGMPKHRKVVEERLYGHSFYRVAKAAGEAAYKKAFDAAVEETNAKGFYIELEGHGESRGGDNVADVDSMSE